jgi:hypothetical protein
MYGSANPALTAALSYGGGGAAIDSIAAGYGSSYGAGSAGATAAGALGNEALGYLAV